MQEQEQEHNWDDYRKMWNELHIRALQHKDGFNDSVWLATWSKRLKPFQKAKKCSCSEHWRKWYLANPPDFKTKDSYFIWTVRAHNSVNKLNNKREWLVSEARKHYQTLINQ